MGKWGEGGCQRATSTPLIPVQLTACCDYWFTPPTHHGFHHHHHPPVPPVPWQCAVMATTLFCISATAWASSAPFRPCCQHLGPSPNLISLLQLGPLRPHSDPGDRIWAPPQTLYLCYSLGLFGPIQTLVTAFGPLPKPYISATAWASSAPFRPW